VATQVQSSDFAADIGTQVYWLALLVGLLVGVLGVGFHSLVDLLAALRLSLVAGAFDGTPALRAVAFWIDRGASSLSNLALPAFDATLAARVVVTAAVVASGLAVARWLVRRFAPEAGGSGVQEIEGVLLGLRPMRWRRILAVKSAAGGMALGAGFVLGREGPTVQMGGAAALGIARQARCNEGEAKALLAAGAGAGIAAAFNAPIAGVLFVVEELRREAPYNFQGYHAVLIACVAATLVTEAVAGVGPELRLQMSAPLLPHYPLFAGLGLVLGACGVLFNRILVGASDLFAAWSRRAGWSLVLALSLGLTALLFVAPAATGGGEQIVQPLTSEHRSLAALLLLLALRAAATVSSYAAGTPGGVFAPILGLAAVAGVAYAETITALVPGLDLEPAAFAAAAMAALFTGSVRAPLVAVVLVSELTDAYPAVLAITLSSAMASLTAAGLRGRPLYELLLERTLRLQR
jgi:chloride channel protein, CIC family